MKNSSHWKQVTTAFPRFFRDNFVLGLFSFSALLVIMVSIIANTVMNRSMEMLQESIQNHLVSAVLSAVNLADFEELDKYHVEEDTTAVNLSAETTESTSTVKLYSGTAPGTFIAGGSSAVGPYSVSLNPESNDFYLEVTAESSDTKIYPITIFRGDASKTITAFTITSPVSAAGTVDGNTHAITVNVPYGTDVTAMTASVSHTGASISPNPATAKSYAGPVT